MNEELSLCRRPIPSHFGRVTLYNIAEELRCHILGFLAHNEIIRCALTCRTIYLTVKNSLNLQYAIELGTQGLVQVHPRPPTVSITECMRILREHANAWSSFKLNVTKRLHFREISSSWSITHQHLGLSWYIANRFGTAAWPLGNTALSKVVDIKTCTPQMANGPFCTWTKDNPVPGIEPVETCYVDETHDLLVTVDAWKVRLGRKSKCRVKYRVNFRTLSTGKEHPLAHGSQEVVMTGTSDRRFSSTNVYHRMLVIILGDRIALYSGVVLDLSRAPGDDLYLLHVWNWHEGCEADDICVIGKDLFLVELCFLTPEKLLALTSESLIELYDVEDLSKAPQLQARFMMPIRTLGFRFQYPSVYHSASSCAHLRAPDEHWIWTTNPEDRVICVTDFNSASNFVITARLFFMNIPPSWFDETSEDGLTVPWLSWGPQNSRCFQATRIFGVGGSRVIWVIPQGDNQSVVHMTDFNPSAVARGVGNVIRKRTTWPQSKRHPEQYVPVTTYLPYVEVASDLVLDYKAAFVILDDETVLIFPDAQTVDIIKI